MPDTDQADYLVHQLQDVADICNITTLRDISTRPLFPYDKVTSATRSSVTTSTAALATATCTGQVLSSNTSQHCDDLSQKYGVTTGDLHSVTNNEDCSISTPVCLPPPCTLQRVDSNSTWSVDRYPSRPVLTRHKPIYCSEQIHHLFAASSVESTYSGPVR